MSKGTLPRAFAAVFILLLIALITFAFALSGSLSRSQQKASTTPATTVIIDAGHGGEDGGAVGDNGSQEKTLNLQIAMILRDLLQSEGINVIMTRTEDILLYDRNEDFEGRKKVLDLEHRLKVSQDNPGALFISIHMNAFPQKKYDGLQVYFPIEDEYSHALASIIQTNVQSTLQPQNLRKPKGAGSNIYLLDKNPNPAVLIECGFLSNDAECARLNDPLYRKQLALVLYNSIIKFLSSGKESP